MAPLLPATVGNLTFSLKVNYILPGLADFSVSVSRMEMIRWYRD